MRQKCTDKEKAKSHLHGNKTAATPPFRSKTSFTSLAGRPNLSNCSQWVCVLGEGDKEHSAPRRSPPGKLLKRDSIHAAGLRLARRTRVRFRTASASSEVAATCGGGGWPCRASPSHSARRLHGSLAPSSWTQIPEQVLSSAQGGASPKDVFIMSNSRAGNVSTTPGAQADPVGAGTHVWLGRPSHPNYESLHHRLRPQCPVRTLAPSRAFRGTQP